MKKIIDVSKAKRMYWDYNTPISNGCPECDTELVNETHSFVLAVKMKDEIKPFMAGTDAGHFCPVCPVVVIDSEKIKLMAAIGAKVDEPEFAVAGLVDFDAVPKNKKHLPLGTDDNPIPLVEFLPPLNTAVKSKKVGRNEPCPCGSGKKFKKCCL